MTNTQRDALKMLAEHGGEGVRTNRRTLLAAGVELGEYDGEELMSAFAWKTWAALRDAGMVAEVAPKRLRITDAGHAALGVSR